MKRTNLRRVAGGLAINGGLTTKGKLALDDSSVTKDSTETNNEMRQKITTVDATGTFTLL